MANTNINNGFIQPILETVVSSSSSNRNIYTREWRFRAWSNHLGADESFTLLTHGAAVYWLWVIDEIEGGRSNRNKARD